MTYYYMCTGTGCDKMTEHWHGLCDDCIRRLVDEAIMEAME